MNQSYSSLNRDESLTRTITLGSTARIIVPMVKPEDNNFEIKEIGNYKVLSKQDSLNLFRRYKHGEKDLREYLFHVNIGLVLSIARKYKNKHPDIEFDDLVQEGNEGMLRAIEDFNPDLGYCFSTYAYWWIKKSMLGFIRKKKSGPFKIPNYVNQFNVKYVEIEDKYLQMHNRTPTVEEVVKELDVTREMVVRHDVYYKRVTTMTLDIDTINEDIGILNPFYDDSSAIPSTNEMIIEDLNYEIWLIFDEVLNPKQKIVLNLCFGLLDSKVYLHKEIAKALMITTERVSQLKDEAINRLKKCDYKDEIFNLLHEKLKIMDELNLA
ncbi:sigma-70 family RNA polymerase sigma factor [Bacillus cereus]|uniref:Sigma-70 family RNA polymerase sigma factor n=1 Tax=Bacillus cereus MC67 TaxID=1053219 RepID=J8E609_BACCE|nr:sigma-70 family RNA polymerase sigma factor [Bacillus cereus]EJQ92416.1 sigma-70 family RNA polymerase sigma factor [Bacillus cereus MC67]EOP08851.1 sigma-70 family RNA polymerase sigma factor [Bacillus cereus MC118]